MKKYKEPLQNIFVAKTLFAFLFLQSRWFADYPADLINYGTGRGH
ncbi:hypothetical protein ACTNEW_13930 [Blautia sp. HCP3S3_G3]